MVVAHQGAELLRKHLEVAFKEREKFYKILADHTRPLLLIIDPNNTLIICIIKLQDRGILQDRGKIYLFKYCFQIEL